MILDRLPLKYYRRVSSLGLQDVDTVYVRGTSSSVTTANMGWVTGHPLRPSRECWWRWRQLARGRTARNQMPGPPGWGLCNGANKRTLWKQNLVRNLRIEAGQISWLYDASRLRLLMWNVRSLYRVAMLKQLKMAKIGWGKIDWWRGYWKVIQEEEEG